MPEGAAQSRRPSSAVSAPVANAAIGAPVSRNARRHASTQAMLATSRRFRMKRPFSCCQYSTCCPEPLSSLKKLSIFHRQ